MEFISDLLESGLAEESMCLMFLFAGVPFEVH